MLARFALGHDNAPPIETFVRQQAEARYFAAAVLAPEQAATALLQQSKQERELSIDDLREAFYLSYETAASRFTNLATHHLGIRTHFVRSDEEGTIWKAYENDDVPLPRDSGHAIEGLKLCRQWSARQVFGSPDKLAPHYQYVDTLAGTFWNVTQLEADANTGRFNAVTVGVAWEDARLFRGRNTDQRTVSRCPDGDCCRQPAAAILRRWEGKMWPVFRTYNRALATMTAGGFLPPDWTDVYEFLDRQPV